jgi:hypothetical protein
MLTIIINGFVFQIFNGVIYQRNTISSKYYLLFDIFHNRFYQDKFDFLKKHIIVKITNTSFEASWGIYALNIDIYACIFSLIDSWHTKS